MALFGLIRPVFELSQDFMVVSAICKLLEDATKHKGIILVANNSHSKPMGTYEDCFNKHMGPNSGKNDQNRSAF